jgi:hypothetical protein
MGHEKGADLIETQANYRTPPRLCSHNSLGRQLEVSNLINERIALEPPQRNLLDELKPQILEVFARRATEPIRQVLTATECVTPSSGCRLRELAQALSVAALKYPENVPVPGGHPTWITR